jgi:microcystin-dependent protein
MDNYLGEIRIFPYSRIPSGWLACNGQTLQIQQYQALFSLLSSIYGGNGSTNFNLPNLNGKVIVGQGTSTTGTTYQIGIAGGAASVALTTANIPAHNHTVNAATTYDSNNATNELLGNPNVTTSTTQTDKNIAAAQVNLYGAGPANTTLNSGSITTTGTAQAHENRMPYMALIYCIATSGQYPTRS